MTTRPPRAVFSMAAARPCGLPDDSMVTSGCTVRSAALSEASRVPGRAECPGAVERGLVQIDDGDLGCTRTAQDGDDQRADRPGPDHEGAPAPDLSRTAHGMPGDAGRLGERGRAQRQPGGQRTEHVRLDRQEAREPALGVRMVGGAAEVGAAGGDVGPVGGVALGAVARMGPGRVHGDRGPGRRPRPVGGGAADGADDLVAEQHRFPEDRHPGGTVLPVVQVGAADAAVGDFDDGLVRARGRGRRPARRGRRGPRARPGRRRGPGRASAGVRRSSHDRRHAAVDEDRLPVDVVRRRRREPDGGPTRSALLPQRPRRGAAMTQALNAASSTRLWVISVWM